MQLKIFLILSVCSLASSAQKDKNELSKTVDPPKDGTQEYNPLGAMVR